MRNSIANALEVIGVLVFIGGFIVGIALGNIYPTDNYSDNFNTLLLFETWITSFIIGMMFLGFAELIEQNFRSAEFLSYLVDASRTNAMNNNSLVHQPSDMLGNQNQAQFTNQNLPPL